MVLKQMTWFIHMSSYYICWIACIYFASHNAPYTGPIITLGVLFIQIIWQRMHQKPFIRAVVFAISLAILGSSLDTAWLYSGQIYFYANPFGAYFSPPWMICLWLSFGFNLVVMTEHWFHHYLVWGILVFFSIPFAYWLGVVSGAALLLTNPTFYLQLGIVWGLLLPLSFYSYNLLK